MVFPKKASSLQLGMAMFFQSEVIKVAMRSVILCIKDEKYRVQVWNSVHQMTTRLDR